MKKFVLVLGLVAAFALVNVASAATLAELQASLAAIQAQIAALGGSAATSSSIPEITKSLTVGSKGDEVDALQQYLIDEGLLDIDAPTGYFGPMTKKAVVEWQKANDVTPASGYFGPISRAKLAELAAAAPVTTGTGTTTTTGGTTTYVPDQADGSVVANLRTTPANNQQVNKGDTKDIFTTEFKATNGKVNVTRLDVHTNFKPWLFFSKMQLVDDSGNVLAEKSLGSASDVTEITFDQEYLARFDNFTFVVDPASVTKAGLTVRMTALSSTDKTWAATNRVWLGSSSIRTINGKGFTDTLAGPTGVASSADGRSINFQGNTNGDLVITFSGAPISGSYSVQQSNETIADIAKIGMLAENKDVTLSSLVVQLVASDADLITGLDLYDPAGNRVASADSVSLTASSTFNNFKYTVKSGTRAEFTIKAHIAGQGTTPVYADGSTAYLIVDPATAITASDSSDNTASGNGSRFYTNTLAYYYKTTNFAKAGLNGLTVDRNNGVPTKTASGYIDFSVTAGTYDIYLAKGAVATGTDVAPTLTAGSMNDNGVMAYTDASTTGTSLQLDYQPGSTFLASENGTFSYRVPAGATRTFRVSVSVNNTNGTTGFKKVKIIGFGWATTDAVPTQLTSSANADLSTFQINTDTGMAAS